MIQQSRWNGGGSSVSRFHGGRWSVPSRRLLKQKRDEIAARYASGRTKFDATVTVHLQASFLFLLTVNPAIFPPAFRAFLKRKIFTTESPRL